MTRAEKAAVKAAAKAAAEQEATLLHEMAHLYNLVHDIQDVSNNGYYHNMKFKATAEAHGLHIEKHQKYGWRENNIRGGGREASAKLFNNKRNILALPCSSFLYIKRCARTLLFDIDNIQAK